MSQWPQSILIVCQRGYFSIFMLLSKAYIRWIFFDLLARVAIFQCDVSWVMTHDQLVAFYKLDHTLCTEPKLPKQYATSIMTNLDALNYFNIFSIINIIYLTKKFTAFSVTVFLYFFLYIKVRNTLYFCT